MPQVTRESKRPIRKSKKRIITLCLVLVGVAVSAVVPRWIHAARESTLRAATLAELKELSTSNPDSERVLWHLAVKLENSGNPRAAMDAYWRALQLDEDDERAWSGWERTTEAVLGAEKANQIVDLWLKRSPMSGVAWMRLAHLKQRMGDHQAAYDAAYRASAVSPSVADAWQVMGMEASALSRPTDAEAAFRRAIALV